MILVGTPLPAIDLTSVHGERVRSVDRVGTALVLVLATHRSIGRLDDWCDALVRERVEILPVAILDSLPGFVPESAVRARLRQRSRSPLLMDTGGAVARQLGIETDGASLVVTDADHVVRYTGSDLDETARDAVRSAAGTGPAV